MTKGGEISPPFFIKVVENRGRALLSDRYDDGNMKGTAVNLSRNLLAACVAATTLLCGGAALAQEAKPAAKPFDVKNQFRNICGFCHEDYGRHAGKGPKLMDSERTDDYLANRIKNGLP